MTVSASSTMANSTMAGYELKITRTFDAPRELVWKAWTDPEMAKQWMGPRGFRTTDLSLPAEPGGRWRLEMEGSRPGSDKPLTLRQSGVTKEVKPPELLVYTFAWDDPAAVGLANMDFSANIITVRFEDHGDKTIVHFTQGPFETEGARNGHNSGWNSAFDCFAEFLLAEQPARIANPDDVPSELHLKRFFAAPRQLVFDAWTKPDMLAQWWSPKGFTNPVCEVDARAGGAIYIVMRAPDGTQHPMSGRFIEFYPPYRFNFTAAALDPQGNAMFENWNSVSFDEVDGGTQITLDVHVMSATAVAPLYLKGMTVGWSQSLDKLAGLLEGTLADADAQTTINKKQGERR